jgi:16S rRNA G1207 methylase RsmC
MPQYFDNVEALEHKDITVEFTLQGEKYSLKSDRGVFSKDSLDDGTRYCLKPSSKPILELASSM